MAVRDDSKERELDTFAVTDADKLLKFNIRQQRIVDLCNTVFDDDWFEETKHYSTFQRALKGQPAWVGIVQALEELLDKQTADPRQYLPPVGPPDGDQLAVWMKQIAGAPWWRDVLQLSVPLGPFKNWYSGSSMGKDKVAEVKEKVDEWWARVMAACARAELATLGRGFGKLRDWPNAKVASHFYHLVVERQMPVEQARVLYQKMKSAALDHHSTLIDLTDPKDPLEPYSTGDGQAAQDLDVQEFDTMVAVGYPGAVARFMEPFEPEEWFVKKQWGDRRDEECPKDLNEPLYGLHYRERHWRYWNPKTRRSDGDSEIIETSQDGVTWRAATEREKQGWDRGTYFFCKSLNEGVWPDNSYTLELAELARSFAKEKAQMQKAIDDSEIGEQEDRAWAAMSAAERRFEEAKVRLRLPD